MSVCEAVSFVDRARRARLEARSGLAAMGRKRLEPLPGDRAVFSSPKIDDAPSSYPRPSKTLEELVAGRSVREIERRYVHDLGPAFPARLDQNENPLGTPRVARDAVARVEMNRYPDRRYLELRTLLGAPYGIPPDRIAVGTGGTGLIERVIGVYTKPGDRIVAPHRTYFAFGRIAKERGVELATTPLHADGSVDFDALAAAVRPDTPLVVLCDPANPTGLSASHEAVAAFCRRLPSGVPLLLDQVYREYLGTDGVEAVDVMHDLARSGDRRPVMVLRSASKAMGLAGMRVGWVYASAAEVARRVEGEPIPGPLNASAYAATVAVLRNPRSVDDAVAHATLARRRLAATLDELGIRFYPGRANFLTVRMPVGNAEVVRTLQRGSAKVVVLEGKWMELPPRWLRITVGTADQTEELIRILRRNVPIWRRAAHARRAEAGRPSPRHEPSASRDALLHRLPTTTSSLA